MSEQQPRSKPTNFLEIHDGNQPDKIANYKIPATVIFIDKIPRTPTGKILKRDLRQKL